MDSNKLSLLMKFRTHFISGLLVLAPFFLTVIFMGYLFRIADAFFVNPLFRLLPTDAIDASFLVLLAKVAIGVVVVLLIALIGLAAEKLIFRQLMATGEYIFQSIPVFNKVYGSIKEIKEAFFGDKRGVFREAVFFEYPRAGIYSLGFITQDKPWALQECTGKDVVTVFVPSPPNPATGYFVFVPKEQIIPSGLTIEEGIKLIISGGAAVPPLRAGSSQLAAGSTQKQRKDEI